MTLPKLKKYFLSLFFICCGALLATAQTPCTSGMAGTYPCDSIDLMAHILPATLGNPDVFPNTGGGNDIWGWTHPVTGKEYALVGLRNGTAFVDVSAPSSPINIGFLPSHTVDANNVPINNSWRDIKVVNDHAYIVSEATGHGVQIFELDRLDVTPSTPITFTEDGWINMGRAHNIVANEEKDLIYPVGTNNTCSGAITSYDVSNPTSPTNASCVSAGGYTHDAICFTYRGPDTDHTGKNLCFGFNANKISILDMDLTSIQEINTITYDSTGYTHQGWITDDQKYLLFNDELDEGQLGINTTTHIYNISDLDNPVKMASFVSTEAAIDHNLYIRGPYVYQANYRAGLRVLDISDLDNGLPTEVAYFDIYPGSNSASFSGAWSVYPYFDSGTLIVNGIGSTGGLFVLNPNLPHNVIELVGTGVDTICQGDDAVFELNNKAFAGITASDNLVITGLPSGTSASFSANPVPVNSSTTITITGTSSLSNGNYTFMVTGTELPKNRMSLSFTVAGSAPTSVGLVYPPNNANNLPPSITFNWNPSATADYYDLEVSSDPFFTTLDYSATGLTTTNHTFNITNPGVQYFWRVKSFTNTCSASATSLRYSFSLNDNPTPVELTKFQARAGEGMITLDWQTASELNNKGFELERAMEADLLNFEKIAWIDSQDGNAQSFQNYTYPDRDVRPGILYYYRLKQIDFDGQFSYSPTVSASLENSSTTISAFPNPAQDQLSLQLDAASFYRGEAELSVYDMTGKLILVENVEMEALTTPYSLDISNLSKGTYLLQLSNSQLNLPVRFVKY